MNGKAFGFELVLGPDVRQPVIWAGLSRLAPTEWKRAGVRNFFKVAPADGVIAGTVLRLRGERQDMTTETKSLRTRVRTTEPGEELSAVTHFILCQKSMKGLFFAYPGALPFGDFRTWLEQTCGGMVHTAVRKAREEAKAKAKGGKLTAEATRAIGDGHSVECRPYMRRDKLEELLAAWKSINGFEYVVSSSVMKRHQGSPIYPHTTRIVYTLKLSSDAIEDGKRAGVRRLVGRIFDTWRFLTAANQIDPNTEPKVRGTDEADQPKTIHLDEVMDCFLTEPVGAAQSSLDWSTHDPLQSHLVAKLRAVASAEHSVFGIPSR